MRYFKHTIAVVLVMLILVSVLPASPVSAASGVRYGREKLGQMSNGADLQYVYDQLVTGCGNAEADIQIDVTGRSIDFNSALGVIFDMFYSDYPEYFWVNGAWNASITQQDSTVTLIMTPTYTMTGSALQSARAAYEAKVNALTSGLSGSDYDKAKTLHDRLIDTVRYASTANDQNAYGALVEGKAVCNGYARAYQHLMSKAGIPAWFVSGTSINPVTNAAVGHAWNLVKLDGQWYYTDVTWDDQGENTFYTYFNIPTSQLLEGHAIGAKYQTLVPNATATAANFYVKEGRSFDTYDHAKLVSLLKKDGNKTQIYIKGNMGDFVSQLDANLLSLAADLGATGSYEISYKFSQLGHAMILDVDVSQTGNGNGTPTETEPTGSTEPTRDTEPTSSTEPTRGTEPTSSTEPTRGTEPTDNTEPTDGTEPADGTDPTEITAPIHGTESTGNTESTDSAVSTDNTQATEATSPVADGTTAQEETAPQNMPKTDNGAMIWVWIGGAVVAAAAVATVAVIKKKKSKS